MPNEAEILRPMLELHSDGEPKQIRAVIDGLAGRLALPEEEKNARYPSGNRMFDSLAYSAARTLRGAGLLQRDRLGVHHITERGQQALTRNPERIDAEFLRKHNEESDIQPEETPEQTPSIPHADTEEAFPGLPESRIQAAHAEINAALKQELLEEIGKMPPEFFERLVMRLLEKMGYGSGQVTPLSKDGGVDVVLQQNSLGLDKVLVQAKRWQGKVGGPEIRDFIGTLDTRKANKGVFITTSAFTPDAERNAVDSRIAAISLIDGNQLTDLMIKHKVGVVLHFSYEINKMDFNYFADG